MSSQPEISEDTPMVNDEDVSTVPKEIVAVIDSLKQEVDAQRLVYVQKIIEANQQKLSTVSLNKEKANATANDTDDSTLLLVKRQEDAVNMQNGSDLSSRENDSSGSQEDTGIHQGSNLLIKTSVRPIRLLEVKRLPPYTTWLFLGRNQRMPEEQSVVGRRRIYYDPSGGEALICSDSEEEINDEEEDKKEFIQSVDYILRMAAQLVGLSDAVLEQLGHCFSRKPCDIKARYEFLCGDGNAKKDLTIGDPAEISESANPYLDKDLEGALDSFDNLFCRRWYVFDCRLHGCSQDLIFPTEKRHPSVAPEVPPCGPDCYRSGKQKGKYTQSESASSHAINASDSSDSDDIPGEESEDNNLVDESSICIKTKPSGMSGIRKIRNKRGADRLLTAVQKRQTKLINQVSDSLASEGNLSSDMKLRPRTRKKDEDIGSSSLGKVNSSADEKAEKGSSTVGSSKILNYEATCNSLDVAAGNPIILDDISTKEDCIDESPGRQEYSIDTSWKALEKALYDKGLEIFGRSSCLIARNLLSGLKTCTEVYHYMTHLDKKLFCEGGINGTSFDSNKLASNEVRKGSRYVRRKGRSGRLKYTWKSSGYHSIRKRISERKDQPCRQFNPCGCQTAFGKECPKSCKNSFRCCHCAKSQCRSRQCPCFAADRECDPDVCRNCWVSCGDGTTPNQSGDNYECRNMKLLLKQQQQVLLGRSDVSGLGAFLKFVLDAFRKGDKLKFANHSPNPNCYAKVIMVAGDHRVGIFAKERINGGEELFYDYRYEPDRAPAWAKKPEAPGSKKDDAGPSSKRARKLA